MVFEELTLLSFAIFELIVVASLGGGQSAASAAVCGTGCCLTTLTALGVKGVGAGAGAGDGIGIGIGIAVAGEMNAGLACKLTP